MEIINVYEKSQNKWTIRPGPVGSVGDANMQVRLKGNMPDSKIRYDHEFSGPNEKFYGSNVQDGVSGSGGSARVISRKIGSRPGQKTSVGWKMQNILPEDRYSETVMKSLGTYSWDLKRAQLIQAKVSGERFLPGGGGYDKSLLQATKSLARGNQHPRVVDVERGNEYLNDASGSLTSTEMNQNIISSYQPPKVGQEKIPAGGWLRPIPGKIFLQ